jgi:hypothetical protein
LSIQRTLSNLSPFDRLTAIDTLMSKKENPILTLSEIPLDEPLSPSASTLNDVDYHSILTVLFAINSAFSETIKFDNFLYILDDRSVYNACQYLENNFSISYEQFLKKLEVLSLAGLIYRFNVAMKFGYPAQDIFQLRLNSWGRELVKQTGLAESGEFTNVKQKIKNYLAEHIEIYNKITAICDAPIEMIDIESLHHLNSTLMIKVVT